MIRIVSLKFRTAGKHYTFNARDLELKGGDRVVVETDRGRALGSVVLQPREVPRDQAPEDIKNVLRLATEEDLSMAASHAGREKEAYGFCQRRIEDRKMDMKLVRAEYLFDGSKIVFYFTADGRVDFRELVKDLAHYFHTRIEMRQIGVRDEAKLTGGIGICGRELCCCTFLTEFAPVSVRMAKEQGLALNPNKISGQCGRLLCCLGYEFETYCALKKALPKCGRRVKHEGREGDVVAQDVLGQKVTVRFLDGKTAQVPAGETEIAKDQESAQQKKPSQPGEPREPKKKQGGRPRGGKPQGQPKPARATREKPPAPPKVTAPEPAPDGEAKPGKKRSRSRRRPRRK